ncbi:hypothetical protein B0H13DRAFT_2261745 [Mycena leptocephala]|nr:hypothetical protein B0H13DRAFT_2261745 [Mycena leptocephala]
MDWTWPLPSFLGASAERCLTAIAVSFLTHMVQDKILSGLSSAYSPIVTLLQLESPQRDVTSMINAINAWEPRERPRTSMTRIKGYCVSVMPEDVRRRIIRNRERQAQLAEDESSDSERGAVNGAATATTNSHIAAAIFDLPTELHIDTMDPDVRESWLSTLGNDVHPIPQHFAHTAIPTNIDPGPSPPSPMLTASSVTSTPTKKKKKSTTVNEIQSVFEGMSLKEADEVDEAEYSM